MEAIRKLTCKFAGGIYKLKLLHRKELVIRITPVKERYNCFAAAEVTEIWGSNFRSAMIMTALL